MSSKMDNLDELLECAVREAGAIRHMEELDRQERMRRRGMRFMSYGAAACVSLGAFGMDYKLSSDARKVGYGFIPADGQAGGSEITALMQEKKIDEARELIVEAKSKIEEEFAVPLSDDPEYMAQLAADKDELDLLDAVCLLRKGKWLKGKKALKKIEAESGAFAQDAKDLLEKL